MEIYTILNGVENSSNNTRVLLHIIENNLNRIMYYCRMVKLIILFVATVEDKRLLDLSIR